METRVPEAFVDRDRRNIVTILIDAEGRITVDDLVEELVTSRKGRKSVRIHLYHFHLPKLETAGVLEYDWDAGEIVLAEEEEVLTTYLDTVEDEDSAPMKIV